MPRYSTFRIFPKVLKCIAWYLHGKIFAVSGISCIDIAAA
jgi:hypothetical protein